MELAKEKFAIGFVASMLCLGCGGGGGGRSGDACASFPPPEGRRLVYEASCGGGQTELAPLFGCQGSAGPATGLARGLILAIGPTSELAGRTVYLQETIVSPFQEADSGNGRLIGCDDSLGEVIVATIWQGDLLVYDNPPPVSCPYGTAVGDRRCDWAGRTPAPAARPRDDDIPEVFLDVRRTLKEVQGYQDVTVAAGQFSEAMVLESVSFGCWALVGRGGCFEYDEANFLSFGLAGNSRQWVVPGIGQVRIESTGYQEPIDRTGMRRPNLAPEVKAPGIIFELAEILEP